MTNKYAEQVKEFNTAFNQEDTKVYTRLIREEFNEWYTEYEEAPGSDKELKELCDLLYVIYGKADLEGWAISPNKDDIAMITKAITERSLPLSSIITAGYCEWIVTNEKIWLERFLDSVMSYAAIRKFPVAQAFSRVHKSNMSKLDNGIVLKNADGKVLKGPKYKAPELKSLLSPVAKVKATKAKSPSKAPVLAKKASRKA